ncbi:pentatricopeptide repeat-containing protein At4g04370-like [Salvia splendens]|uniref:pentatricopeptide repeat-containing protein At4g04370-like n=1 Tax=Salvia splendens TaxID=180675 RepID=UPI001C26B522|nr:pentatricopeptide repeat-containing protein At4g04370-like [Salvia splendens]
MKKLKLSCLHPPTPSAPPLTAAGATTANPFNATITRLSAKSFHREVIATFSSMLESPNTNPDAFTYPSVLKACSSLGLFSLGLHLHQHITVNGFSSDAYISSSLINFYAKFNNINYAQKVFDRMPYRNIVPWTSIIWCYSHAGDIKDAFTLYNAMQYEGIAPSPVTILNLLSGALEIEHARVLHACIVKHGYSCDLALMNCLLSAYSKCGRVEDASELFELLDEKDIVSWNSLINAFTVVGNVTKVLYLFSQMRLNNLEPDQKTFGSLVSALARGGSLDVGRVAHGQIITSGFELDKHVGTSLVYFYFRCRNVDDAFQVFERAADKDVIFWTAMISGLVQNDSADYALRVFRKMLLVGMRPSSATMASVTAACALLDSINHGKSIHCYILRQQMAVDIALQNSLVSLYAKCSLLEQSFTVFSKMDERNVVSWNAVVAGYAQNGYLSEALFMFYEMRAANQQPDSITVVSLLQACASIGAYHQGKLIHNYVLRSCLGPCIRIGAALIDMYAKCGNLDCARKCFDIMPEHDSVSWTAIIAGYGSHGEGEAALKMFSEFLQSGRALNDVIFLSVLYACNHNGLVDSGMRYFESMIHNHKIEPKIEHLACIVDLLCRAGRVHDAYSFYRKMFSKPMIDVLGILLDACRNNDDEVLGHAIAEEISEFEHADAGKYVQLAQSFASMDRWDGVGEAWVQMKSHGLRKAPAWSIIELHGTITQFFMQHSSHPENDTIVFILRNLTDNMKRLALTSEYEDLSSYIEVI